MMRFDIEDERLRKRLAQIDANARQPIGLFKRIRVDQVSKSGQMFRRLRRGGTYRGVTWPWFKDQYTRKTDGVTVPAEGGVPRLRAGRSLRTRKGRLYKKGRVQSTGREGTVRGKLRPSGTRVTASSSLMRDTGRLAAAAGSVLRIIEGGTAMEIGTPAPGARQQQKLRPYSFFTRQDARMYRRWAAQELMR